MNTLGTVRRCTCGHVLEWHYVMSSNGGPIFDWHRANRCPSPVCACAKAVHDGQEPKRLQPVTPRPWPAEKAS